MCNLLAACSLTHETHDDYSDDDDDEDSKGVALELLNTWHALDIHNARGG